MLPATTILVAYFFISAGVTRAHPDGLTYPACGDESRNEQGELLPTRESNELLPRREGDHCFGDVEVEFDVDNTGTVTNAAIVSSDELKIFRTIIFNLIYAAEYSPCLFDGTLRGYEHERRNYRFCFKEGRHSDELGITFDELARLPKQVQSIVLGARASAPNSDMFAHEIQVCRNSKDTSYLAEVYPMHGIVNIYDGTGEPVCRFVYGILDDGPPSCINRLRSRADANCEIVWRDPR